MEEKQRRSRSWPELTTGTPRCQELAPESWSGSSKTKASLWEESWSAASWVKWAFRQFTPKANLSKRNFQETIVPYLLRNKAVSLLNQVWSIDITYIKMQHSHMYLTAIIDWYSRMIVGWNLSDTLDTGYVIQAVKDAVAAHGTPAILNSDQGGPLHQQRLQNAVERASHPAEHGR